MWMKLRAEPNRREENPHCQIMAVLKHLEPFAKGSNLSRTRVRGASPEQLVHEIRMVTKPNNISKHAFCPSMCKQRAYTQGIPLST